MAMMGGQPGAQPQQIPTPNLNLDMI
jgi:hypothetical protein